jgi:hypothetical protein
MIFLVGPGTLKEGATVMEIAIRRIAGSPIIVAILSGPDGPV